MVCLLYAYITDFAVYRILTHVLIDTDMLCCHVFVYYVIFLIWHDITIFVLKVQLNMQPTQLGMCQSCNFFNESTKSCKCLLNVYMDIVANDKKQMIFRYDDIVIVSNGQYMPARDVSLAAFSCFIQS